MCQSVKDGVSCRQDSRTSMWTKDLTEAACGCVRMQTWRKKKEKVPESLFRKGCLKVRRSATREERNWRMRVHPPSTVLPRFLVSSYRHPFFTTSVCVYVCVRACARCRADVEHMYSLKRRAAEGIPSSRSVQVCFSDKFVTHVGLPVLWRARTRQSCPLSHTHTHTF